MCLVELSLGIRFGLVSRLLASHIGKKRNGHWELGFVWFGMIGVESKNLTRLPVMPMYFT